MNRFSTLSVPLALLASLVWADSPSQQALRDEALYLHANRTLIAMLVEDGVQLAASKTPLQRADTFRTLAKELVGEINLAAQGQNTARVIELTDHLRTVLDKGIVVNLYKARNEIGLASHDEPELFKVCKDTTELLATLEEQLNKAQQNQPSPELQRTLQAVRKSQADMATVQKTIQPAP
jgi:hypothetical protein